MVIRFTRFYAILAVAVTALTFLPSASAQKYITLADGLEMANTALNVCHAHGYKVEVLIVDASNVPKVEMRDDDTPNSVGETAKVKAYSALVYGRPSGLNIGKDETRHTPTIVPGATRSMGGVPVMIKNSTGGWMVIGAIAVTGIADHEMSLSCAEAGLNAVAARLGARTFDPAGVPTDKPTGTNAKKSEPE